MALRLTPVLAAILIAFAPLVPVQAQQSDADSASIQSPIVDSLQAALDRFNAADPPTAADSAALRRWADSVQTKGRSIMRRKPEKGRSYFQQALRSHRALSDSARGANAIRMTGLTYAFQTEYEKAKSQFKKALARQRALGNRDGAAAALYDIAATFNKQDQYEKALNWYQKSLQLYREIGNRKQVAWNLNRIGLMYWRMGEFEKAFNRYQECLRINREIDNRIGIAGVLNSIGTLHWEQGQYAEALTRYQESLPISRQVGDKEGIGRTLHNIGLIYKNQGEYEKAVPRFKDALQIHRETNDPHKVARILENIGLIHWRQDQAGKALDQFQEALRINREIGNRSGIASALNNIGDLYQSQGRYEEALNQYRSSLSIYREIETPAHITELLKDIGTTLLETGPPRAAVDTLSEGIRYTEQLRRNTISPEARRSLLSSQIESYHALSTAHVRLGRPDSAFRTIEQARARLLADRLAGTATGDTTFTIPSVGQLRRTLAKNEAALLYANTGTSRPLVALTVTHNRVYAHELPDSTVLASIAETYPTQLNRLRRTDGPLAASFDEKNQEATGPTPSLAETIRLYRQNLTASETDSAVQRDLARQFHRLLLAPIKKQIEGKNELIVVPTGALGYLPFETLRDSNGRYLVENKYVRYAQSLTVLRQLQNRDYAEREKPLLAIGGAAYVPEVEIEGDSLIAEARAGSTRVATEEHASTLLHSTETRMEQGKSPRPTYQQLGYRRWMNLPGTKEEVENLGRLMGDASTVITGAGASEDTVRALSENDQLSEHRYVHFATHGVAVPETPKLSALVLSQAKASDSLAARDGYLTMEEIAGLEMQADVAVLSACQSGLGKVVAGEGVVSLSHAFFRAGANATLVSQWKVLDESTRQFMAAVYERAQDENTSFAEAVIETKRAFVDGEHGEKNIDPLRWAPFVYYGRE